MKVLEFIKFAAIAAAIATPAAAIAQDYPSKPVKMFVGFSAGGGTDAIARIYSQKLQEKLGEPFVIENRPGAFQLLGIHPVLESDADGYNLFLGVASSLASGPGVRDDLDYDPLTDFSHVGLIVKAPGLFFVRPDLGVSTIEEFVDYVKDHPGELNFGSAGVGASNHLLMEYIKVAAGIDMVHIPYASDQEVVREVLAGNIDAAITIAQFAASIAKAGDILPLAVAGTERLELLPDVPLLAESGLPGLNDIDYYSFYGVVGPKGMPEDVIQTLNTALNEVSQDPEVQERLDKLIFSPVEATPEEFSSFLEAELARWSKVGEKMAAN